MPNESDNTAEANRLQTKAAKSAKEADGSQPKPQAETVALDDVVAGLELERRCVWPAEKELRLDDEDYLRRRLAELERQKKELLK